MSPEQIAGRRLTTATDVWGLGRLLHEAAHGTTRLPRAAAQVIDACLQADPRARPALDELSETFRAAV